MADSNTLVQSSSDLEKAGIDFYRGWIDRLRAFDPEKSGFTLNNNPAVEAGPNLPINEKISSTWGKIGDLYGPEDVIEMAKPGLPPLLDEYYDLLKSKRQQLFELSGGKAVPLPALYQEFIRKTDGVIPMNELTTEGFQGASHDISNHLWPWKLQISPDITNFKYAGQVQGNNPIGPLNEVFAQAANELTDRGKISYSKMGPDFIGHLERSGRRFADLSLKNALGSLPFDLHEPVRAFHKSVYDPLLPDTNSRLVDFLKSEGVDELVRKKFTDPLRTRLENLSRMQKPPHQLLIDDWKPSIHAWADLENYRQTLNSLKPGYQNSTNRSTSLWDFQTTRPFLMAADPVGAALEGARDLLANKPGVVGHGVLSGADSEQSRDAARTGDWGKVGTNAATGVAKEVAIDAAAQAAQQRLAAFIQGQTGNTATKAFGLPIISRASQFLGPVAQRLVPLAQGAVSKLVPGLVGYDLIKLGQPDSILTTGLNQAGQAYDRFVESNPNLRAVLPKSNTGWNDPTGRVASERDIGKKAADAFVRGYNRFDGMLGGILPGGADPRFNGFNASRDLTPAQQVDYRRGGGDAARRQDPGLTPQQIIERGRQAIAAARRQQNQSTPPGTNPRRTSSPSVQSSRPATRPAQPTRKSSNGLNLWNEALHVADSFRRLKFPYFGR